MAKSKAQWTLWHSVSFYVNKPPSLNGTFNLPERTITVFYGKGDEHWHYIWHYMAFPFALYPSTADLPTRRREIDLYPEFKRENE